jgi:hypothetical protein
MIAANAARASSLEVNGSPRFGQSYPSGVVAAGCRTGSPC